MRSWRSQGGPHGPLAAPFVQADPVASPSLLSPEAENEPGLDAEMLTAPAPPVPLQAESVFPDLEQERKASSLPIKHKSINEHISNISQNMSFFQIATSSLLAGSWSVVEKHRVDFGKLINPLTIFFSKK